MLRRSFLGLLALLPWVSKAKAEPRRYVTLIDPGAQPHEKREYGRLLPLVGDGVTDDSAAIQQRIECGCGVYLTPAAAPAPESPD